MEHSVYYNKSAEHIIRQYCQKLRIRRILGLFLACTDAIVFYCLMERVGYFLGGILILPIYLLSCFLLLVGIGFWDFKSFSSLSKVLYYDCDPVKYQKVLKSLLAFYKTGKAQATISLELATAALALEEPEEGERYLEQATFKKFSLVWKLKKLGCYADCCDLNDDFIGLHQIEEELYGLKANVRVENRFYKEIEHRIRLVQAMASREHESINSQIERWILLYNTADNPLQENLYLMRLARLELAQGKRELSMRHMGFVAAEGNALPCVVEAMHILSMHATAGLRVR